jgi:DNA-binding response OmpR family regulator
LNILIAEDEKDIRGLLAISLKDEGYTVFAAENGIEALKLFRENPVDLAVLDVMMPLLDGFNLLRKIREKNNIPVIFLTARGEDMDKVLGLGLGADDYLVKPFSMPELLARVAAQLRRSSIYSSAVGMESQSKILCGNLVLDTLDCCLYRNNTPMELNAKEYRLLKYLMENPNRVFTKKQLYQAVWDQELFIDDNTVMVHISHLRNKIEDNPKEPVYLKTIRGIGYRFCKIGV